MNNQEILQPKPSNDKNKMMPFIIAGGIAMLVLVGFLMYSNASKSAIIDQKVAELEEVEALRVELETEFNVALAELEDLRGANDELNTLIDAQKSELEEQRSKVAGLIGNKKKLKSARKELDRMKAQISEYIAHIEQLKADNQLLTETNLQLSEDKASLQQDYDNLNEAKAVLVSEKMNWQDERSDMQRKIQLASVVKVKNVSVDGLKVKGNGKLAKKKTAKAVDQLQVCFKTSENEVVKSGTETFLIRIINPLGETLSIESEGSGESVNQRNGESFRYTKSVDVDYLNDEQDACINWSPTNSSFQNGMYQVQVYNKGFLVGEKTMDLR